MKISLLLKKLRPYTLLISIFLGLVTFICFHNISYLAPIKPIANSVYNTLPYLLFFILFFAFSKINFKQMKPKRWHFYLALLQLVVSSIIVLIAVTSNLENNIYLCGALVCIITPTAASASVIASKLGGCQSSLTTYIIISNIAAAIEIPILFPIIRHVENTHILLDFFTILLKVFPLIILPLIASIVVRFTFKKLQLLIINHTKDLGYYLWAFVLVVLSAKTTANIVKEACSLNSLIWMGGVGLLCAILQLVIGKIIGQFDGQRVSAGQGLGQKNTLFAIWIAMAYLGSTVAIIPGTYVLWQNLINAFQMYLREKQVMKCQKERIEPYQE